MSNRYLHWFDKRLQASTGPEHGTAAQRVRYADDFVILARTQSPLLLGTVARLLDGWLGLTSNRDKRRVVDLKDEGVSLDCVGFTFWYERDRCGRSRRYLNVGPSRPAEQRARDKLREMTRRHLSGKPLPDLVADLNRHLKGWAA